MNAAARDVDRPYSGTAGRSSGRIFSGRGRGGRPPRKCHSWPRILVRFFTVVIPAQLLGTAIGGAALGASGLLRDDPQLAILITVVAGVVAGLAVGLLVVPPPDRQRTFLVVNAVFAVGSYVLLLALAQLRLPVGTPPSPCLTYVRGPVLVGLVQTLVALGLWVTRQRL